MFERVFFFWTRFSRFHFCCGVSCICVSPTFEFLLPSLNPSGIHKIDGNDQHGERNLHVQNGDDGFPDNLLDNRNDDRDQGEDHGEGIYDDDDSTVPSVYRLHFPLSERFYKLKNREYIEGRGGPDMNPEPDVIKERKLVRVYVGNEQRSCARKTSSYKNTYC